MAMKLPRGAMRIMLSAFVLALVAITGNVARVAGG